MKLHGLIVVSAALLQLAACTPEHSATDLPPGSYTHDVKNTDENGVTTEHQRTTNVSVDENGNKTAVVHSKTTEKPPGLINGWLNKRTTHESTEVIDEH